MVTFANSVVAGASEARKESRNGESEIARGRERAKSRRSRDPAR